MPIAGKGMLLTSMDIDPAIEDEFNRWYDREHIAERVGIAGFVEARRYVAHAASPKYLGLYSTERFEVLDSPAYRTALANQTAWSQSMIAQFRNMIRAVARITISRGAGRGAALGIVRLRPDPAQVDTLRHEIERRCRPEAIDGVISMHLLESEPALSRSLTDPAATAGAADWYVLIDGTDADRMAATVAEHFDPRELSGFCAQVSAGSYRLLWDLERTGL